MFQQHITYRKYLSGSEQNKEGIIKFWFEKNNLKQDSKQPTYANKKTVDEKHHITQTNPLNSKRKQTTLLT